MASSFINDGVQLSSRGPFDKALLSLSKGSGQAKAVAIQQSKKGICGQRYLDKGVWIAASALPPRSDGCYAKNANENN